uniref:Clusterin-associated protein 1 n=1 Tax=Calcidiscus leptoporus TaxID=127549 RepID=A0A7S0JHU3_9EUKA|mmetsp:Transcript_58954/g.135194  ORF Transcript_58954/g.135194 Transcript_58954/m.135194 type:complete len:436 (+) Transcript_58954:55-1362(+)
MSYRELRNFKEIMCTLGYPRLISIENFKTPHFELVADALVWLCRRYDKNMEIIDEITTEQDRVVFLKSAAEQLLVKARVKLNLKNLYQANGFAVRELLKVAALLNEAHRNAGAEGDETQESISFDLGPGHKFADIKMTRAVSADITKFGSRLFELLGKHAETKDLTAKALGKNHDVASMQKQINRMVEDAAVQAEQMDRMLGNLSQDEANLQQKIDKKKTELDRHQKRLQSLQTVRPAFMDEYEQLESELSAQYAQYVMNWRNLSYLESELDAINLQEAEKIAESDRQLRLMQRRLREEELKILRGQAKVDERALDEALIAEGSAHGARSMKRPGAASTRRDGRRTGGGDLEQEAGVYGGMQPLHDEDEEDEDGEEDDDDDDDDDDSGDGEEDESDDGQVEYTGGGHHDDDDLDDDDDGEEDDELDGEDDDPDAF